MGCGASSSFGVARTWPEGDTTKPAAAKRTSDATESEAVTETEEESPVELAMRTAVSKGVADVLVEMRAHGDNAEYQWVRGPCRRRCR